MSNRGKVVAITAYLTTTIILPLLSRSSEITMIVVSFYSSLFFLGLLWYWIGSKTVLHKQKVKFMDSQDCPELINEIQELITKSRTNAKIQIGLLDNALPNAFTLFLGPHNYLIVFSVGIFENLSSEEIQSVAAHEISHIKNKDVFLKAFFIIGRYCSFPLGPLMESFISRYREFRADEKSTHLTGNPVALASALIKMTKCYQTQPNIDFKAPVGRSFLIIDSPLKSYKGKLGKLLSRHPSIEDRVKRLMELSRTI